MSCVSPSSSTKVVTCLTGRDPDSDSGMPMWRIGIEFEALDRQILHRLKQLIGELISEYWQ